MIYFIQIDTDSYNVFFGGYMESKVYHGTMTDKANKILTEKKFNKSVGDRHWLGDGVYFYTDKYYSYKWVYNMCRNHNTSKCDTMCDLSECFEEVLNSYSILSSVIYLDDSKVLDLDSSEGRAWFHNMLIEFNNACSRKLRDKKNYGAGIFLNFIFNQTEMSKYYNELYYVVSCSFNTHKYISYKRFDINLSFMPERQICVKNLEEVLDNSFFDNLFKCFPNKEEKMEFINNIDLLYDDRIINIENTKENKKHKNIIKKNNYKNVKNIKYKI